MKVIRIIATILVSVSMAFILAYSEQKTASLKGNEDIVAVLQKLPEALDNPEVNREIYADNAILKQEDGWTGHMFELRGLEEIENWRKDRGKVWRRTGLSISSIEKEADTAHINYQIDIEAVKTEAEFAVLSCSAEMLKIGPTWKIKEEIVKREYTRVEFMAKSS
jgi:hypothetical protein